MNKNARLISTARALLCVALVLCLVVWAKRKPFTAAERALIMRADSLMAVMVLPQDSAVLRTPSRDVERRALRSTELRTLLDKMLYTVTDPSQDGVGIAAPQVGINRRIVLVQRLDKDGEPFEAYVNVRLDSLYGAPVSGREGCLSVPGYWGTVTRSTGVVVSYVDLTTGRRRSEHVEGYTARIFQHECDHLDGILYPDRADSLFAAP